MNMDEDDILDGIIGGGIIGGLLGINPITGAAIGGLLDALNDE